jgi:hypothetical protein
MERSIAAHRLLHCFKLRRCHNVELSIYRIAKVEEIAPAIDTAHASGATALNIFAGVLTSANRQLIFDRAAALHPADDALFPRRGEGRRDP